MNGRLSSYVGASQRNYGEAEINLRHQPIVRMTRHFVERWKQRVGIEPTVEWINRIIVEGHRIRRGKILWKALSDPGKYVPIKLLTEYWSPSMNVIIRVDEDNACAVTVITPNGHSG